MANIHETIAEVEKLNPELARQIKRYVKDHSYGLVYESNLPDAVRLHKKSVCAGDVVNILPPRGEFEKAENSVSWVVKEVKDSVATLQRDDVTKEVPIEDVVATVSYRDVIYPGLKEIDRIERGNPDDPYHMVINAENYHALEALSYAYAGKVDCIYIDPPYNTGAKDWKYNNNYVGQDDQYRHSKWLCFIERRLKLAKRLLNPEESVLIVTIDEREQTRLGLLLEQIFADMNPRIQMISSVINFQGSMRQTQFTRTDEYIYVVQIGIAQPKPIVLNPDYRRAKTESYEGFRWQPLAKTQYSRKNHPGTFYPIFVAEDLTHIVEIGDPLDPEKSIAEVPDKKGCITVWPINKKTGQEAQWSINPDKLRRNLEKGYVRLSKKAGKRTGGLAYLTDGIIKAVEKGEYNVIGRDPEDGSIIVDNSNLDYAYVPGTAWSIGAHDATRYGTQLIQDMMPDRKFPFPKSLYAVEDIIRFFVIDKPNALIVDFFAGSGTTVHAVMLLNHIDGGHRRSIAITNNEVEEKETKGFTKAGLRPGDDEWEKYGIATYITWPRVKSAITGVTTTGKPIKGDYKFTEEFPMSDGFKANAIFCELTYESAWPIRLDNAFDAIAPILWMQAGCRGPIIRRIGKSFSTTDYYGVLFDYNHVSKFCDKIKNTPSIKTVFVVTDDQRRYSNVCRRLPGVDVHRLYETYLRTFEICGEGGLD